MAKSNIVEVKIAGDASNLRKAVGDAQSSLGKFGSSLRDVGKKVAIGFTAIGGSAVAGLGLATKAAVEDEKSQKLLEKQLQNSTKATQDQVKAVEDFIEKAMLATGTADDELRPAFSTLVRATEDLTEAQELLTIAQDISAATGKPLETVSIALGKAATGQTTSLKRLGIQIDDNVLKSKDLDAIQQALSDKFSGSAKTAADTYEGRMKRVKVALDETVETIGYAMMPALSTMLGFINDKVVPLFQSFADTFEKEGFAGVMERIGTSIKEGAPIALNYLKDFLIKIGKFIVDVGLPWIAEKSRELTKALWEWVQEAAPPAIRALGDMIGRFANWALDEGLPMLVDKMKQLGQALVDWIEPRIAPMLQEMGKLIAKLAEWAITEALPKLLKLAMEWAWALTGWVFQLAPEIIKGIGSAFVEIIKKLPGIAIDLLAKMGNLGLDIAKAIFNGLVDGIKNAPGFVLDLGKAIINGIIGFLNTNVIDWINSKELSTPFGKLGLPDLPHIPKLAEGGLVMKPTLALIGERGPEAVIPLPPRMPAQPAGDTYVTIQVTRADPDAVVAALRQYMRTNGAVPIRTASAI